MPNLFTEFSEVIHTIGDLLFGLAAVIAALSSLRNGRKIDQHDSATKMIARNHDNGGQ